MSMPFFVSQIKNGTTLIFILISCVGRSYIKYLGNFLVEVSDDEEEDKETRQMRMRGWNLVE